MGVEADYRRITPREWEEFQGLIAGAKSLSLVELQDAFREFRYSEGMMSSDRYLSIEKDWHALHALLTGDLSGPLEIEPLPPPLPPPLGNVVLGGTETPFDATYGQVRVLTPDEVREVAEALATITADDLEARFDPVAFNEAGVYPNPRPGGWDLEELESLLVIYPDLVEFFGKAAQAGNLVLLSLD